MEPSRQIHLDFHTSELIPDIGGGFEKKQFQEALRAGRVNLINVFAKCFIYLFHIRFEEVNSMVRKEVFFLWIN